MINFLLNGVSEIFCGNGSVLGMSTVADSCMSLLLSPKGVMFLIELLTYISGYTSIYIYISSIIYIKIYINVYIHCIYIHIKLIVIIDLPYFNLK